jgi:hypothetical protein
VEGAPASRAAFTPLFGCFLHLGLFCIWVCHHSSKLFTVIIKNKKFIASLSREVVQLEWTLDTLG